MSQIVFLLEELSARDLLEGLLPKLLPEDIEVRYLVFEGKQDLERNLVKKLRGWRLQDSLFVVLRDQDAADCVAVKKRLVSLVSTDDLPRTLVRVACREIESWVLGDWQAVGEAFAQPQFAAYSRRAKFRNPDELSRPIEFLRNYVPAYQKREGARRVGRLLDPDRNQSPSFRAFCSGVRRLIAEKS